jgi:hypothetical protein
VWGEVGEIGKAGAGFGLVGLRVGRKSFLGTRANSDALTLGSKKKIEHYNFISTQNIPITNLQSELSLF